MFKTRRAQPEASGGSRSYRHSFWKNESSVPQTSDVEAVKKLASKAPTAPSRPVPVPVPTATAIYHKQPQSSLGSFTVVHNGNSRDSAQDHRNAHSTSRMHALQSQIQASVFEPQQQQILSSQKTLPKPAPPVSAHAHRVSVQSLNSTNTASTSRSSFEHISQDNLQHSWGSATFSTAPSSNLPPSTESLTRIPAAADNREPSTLDRQLSASRRFPLVESDSQKKSIASNTHAAAQAEQPSNALPLPNSEYESPARVRSLRRSKGPITSNSGSLRIASSQEPFSPTTGRESPTPTAQKPPTPTKPQDHKRSKSDMLATTEIAYVRQSRIVSEDYGNYGTDGHSRATLLSRVMGTATGAMRHSPSTASTRTMSNTQPPRVSTTSNAANPNMLKLKQTTVPRISSSGMATASPAVESTKISSIHSPRQSAESTVPAWNYTRSPAVTSGPTYGALKSTVMSPHLSTVASPRTLVSSAHPHHPSDLPPIQPSQYSTSTSYRVQAQDFRDDESSLSTAIPATPTSTTVRALFSSLTSRPHRNSTPHPLRTSSISNQPITVGDNRAADVLTPPPLPPPSTRPDAPQQQQQRDFGLGSPRQTSAESTRSKTASASRRDSPGLRSPSPTQPSILKSYGLENNPMSPSTPSKNPLGTPFHGQRTLMSDSEYTVTTSVVSVRQTVVSIPHSAAGGHSIVERRSSSSQKYERTGSITPANVDVPPSPQVRVQSPQRSATVPEPSHEQQPTPNVRPATGGLFNMFRPKSPRPFPMVERSASPAPVSKTPPPRASTSSPRRFPFSFPINLRHKPKKSISGASVEAVIGGTKLGMTESAMSSQGSFQPTPSPDPRVEFSGAKASDRKFLAKLNNERKERERIHQEDETEDDNDGDDEPPLLDRMIAVQKWNMSTEENWKQSGKSRRTRPGVSFDLPPSESERDDSGMTQVSVAPGGGRMLRYARAHHNDYSDCESTVNY